MPLNPFMAELVRSSTLATSFSNTSLVVRVAVSGPKSVQLVHYLCGDPLCSCRQANHLSNDNHAGTMYAMQQLLELLMDSAGVGSGFSVVRYHSLAVQEASLPACLQPIAWTCGSHQALRPITPQVPTWYRIHYHSRGSGSSKLACLPACHFCHVETVCFIMHPEANH